MKRRMSGFQKPLRSAQRTEEAGFGIVKMTEAGLSCSCGAFVSNHPRAKVREDQAERHFEKAHRGLGVVF